MNVRELAARLQQPGESKILLVVADGLGGIPGKHGGSELEEAVTPNLDAIARDGASGLLLPVAPGITPGSGPGHLALFGYAPLVHDIGRGVLTALGIGFELRPGDVAARGNFCTRDSSGLVADRRAGRIGTDAARSLVDELRRIEIEGVEVFVEPVKEHRFLLVLRGEGLGDGVSDTDPHQPGLPPREPEARDAASAATAEAISSFMEQAGRLLQDRQPANGVLLRGFQSLPGLPSMKTSYGVRACAVAGYPMYRGVARLLGMEVVERGPELDDEVDALGEVWHDHDFFFLHYKATDTAGEDGDFDAKVAAIETLDAQIPRIEELRPDVIVVTADHSTPSQLASHSWHPVPVVLGADTCRRDDVAHFGETACARGGLGQMQAQHLMTMMLAHAGRLRRFGA
ncbi:MAG: 2,3-bisphosphoglycerate-independent phosphoglycerate mutase [Pseudomonadota bacterium]